MWRKRKNPAPYFRNPAPYNPLSGEHAPIGRNIDRTRIAMMQVIEADTHDNYLVCRGYDPDAKKFLHSVNVAKQYPIRGTFPYRVGCVLPAAKPSTMLGETSGVSATTLGCPADLNEVINILLDDNDHPIAWLDIGTQTSPLVRFILRTELIIADVAHAEIITLNADGTQHLTGKLCTVFDWACEFYGAADSAWGEGLNRPDTPNLAIVEGEVTYEILRLTCPGFAGCPAP